MITLPEHPKQGDVVEWWSMHQHPVQAYVQHHRATYYQSAACRDVLGDQHKSGKPFDCEWLIETWYAPSGSKTSGGRNVTDALRQHLAKGPSDGAYATWAEARAAAVADMRQRATELEAQAESLKNAARKLETCEAIP